MRHISTSFALALSLAFGLSGCDYVHFYECFDGNNGNAVAIGHAKKDGICDCVISASASCPGVPDEIYRGAIADSNDDNSDGNNDSNNGDGSGNTTCTANCSTLVVRSNLSLESQAGTAAQPFCVTPTNGDRWKNRGASYTWSRNLAAVINVRGASYSHCVDPGTGIGWGACPEQGADTSVFVGTTPEQIGCIAGRCTANNTFNWYCPSR